MPSVSVACHATPSGGLGYRSLHHPGHHRGRQHRDSSHWPSHAMSWKSFTLSTHSPAPVQPLLTARGTRESPFLTSPVNGWKNPLAEGRARFPQRPVLTKSPTHSLLLSSAAKSIVCGHLTYLASLLLRGICAVSICRDYSMMGDLVCASIHTSEVELSVTWFPHP